jgi:peptide/nickel transport system permease protein
MGLVILVFLTIVAILAGILAPYDPVKPLIGIEDVKKRQSPCIHLLGCPQDQPQHLFGIDGNVRDEFSRVLYGARLSLIIGFVTVTFAIIIGTILGLFSGYLGGWVDNISMRSMDVLLAFPSLLLAIAIVTVLGPGLINALLAIGIVSIPIYARVTRANVLLRSKWSHDHDASCLTQLADTADCLWHVGNRDSHSGRSRFILPRTGSTTTHS